MSRPKKSPLETVEILFFEYLHEIQADEQQAGEMLDELYDSLERKISRKIKIDWREK